MRFKLRNHELMDLRTGKIYINKDEAIIDAINLIVDELDKLNTDNKELMGLINNISEDCSRHLNDIDEKINNIDKEDEEAYYETVGYHENMKNAIMELIGDDYQTRVLDYLEEIICIHKHGRNLYDTVLEKHGIRINKSHGFKEYQVRKDVFGLKYNDDNEVIGIINNFNGTFYIIDDCEDNIRFFVDNLNNLIKRSELIETRYYTKV